MCQIDTRWEEDAVETRKPEPEATPEQHEDWQEYLHREAQLLAELQSGALTKADYRRLKEEAWDDYVARTGRLVVDEEGSSSPAPPVAPD
jgi:hypothetical protein